jgi:hypothetical protein
VPATPAPRALALTAIASDAAHGIIKQDDLGYRTARFAGKDTHKAAVIDVRFRVPPTAALVLFLF